MHPFLWAALGAAAAAPVVMIATLLGALLMQVMSPTAFQLKSLARQKRLGPRKGVTSGDPVLPSEPLESLPAAACLHSVTFVLSIRGWRHVCGQHPPKSSDIDLLTPLLPLLPALAPAFCKEQQKCHRLMCWPPACDCPPCQLHSQIFNENFASHQLSPAVCPPCRTCEWPYHWRLCGLHHRRPPELAERILCLQKDRRPDAGHVGGACGA